jgi:hypothetical protein
MFSHVKIYAFPRMKIIREQSNFRTIWDFIILILIIVSIIIIPVQLAFQHEISFEGSVIVYAIDIFFIIDLYINSNTSFRTAGAEITDKTSLLKHYNKTNLKIDLIASLPFDALFLIWSGFEIEGISIVIWLRTFRLLRIQHLFVILSRWQNNHWVNPGYLRFTKFVVGMSFLSHLVACMWYLSAYIAHFPVKSWVVLNGIENSDNFTIYVRSLYWTITTMTTVGYGDITPHLNYEYIFAIFIMIIGAAMYAFIIGNIASIVSALDIQKTSYWNKLDTVKLYLRYRGVPAYLNERVRNYYEYRWENHRGLEEQQLLHELPDPLRLQIMMQLAKSLLDKIPLFKYSSENLRNVLLLALKSKTFDPNSLIVRSGETAKEIFFISKGSADIINESGKIIYGTISEGDYFGNLSIMFGEQRTASIRTTGFCETFVLYSEEFFRIKKEYPEFLNVMKKISADKTEKTSQLLLEGIIL